MLTLLFIVVRKKVFMSLTDCFYLVKIPLVHLMLGEGQ